MTATWHTGDVFEIMAALPDASVDLVMTSPPFLALRSYLPADHPDKAKEIGQESNPGAFLDVLLDVVVELRRVLAPHGSLCVELGDTYSGARGYGNPDSQNPAYGERAVERWEEARVERRFKKDDDGWPEAKSLCLIPSSFAWALAYGRNPWTGRELDPWRVRNLIAWCRPNPPVGALGDKFRPATSYMTVACVGGSRYFDLDAVREINPDGQGVGKPAGRRTGTSATYPGNGGNHRMAEATSHPAGAPPLDYWVIPTHPYKGSHYATFPPDLCVKPIKSMCPERVCRECGKPSERIVATDYEGVGRSVSTKGGDRSERAGRVTTQQATGVHVAAAPVQTLGWTDCGHNNWRPGVVLDCFAGSGTTGSVATGMGRDFIGIDLDERNYDLARERIGMFLEPPVIHGGRPDAA